MKNDTKTIEIIKENVINEIEKEKKGGVENYLFAVQFRNDVISVVEVNFEKVVEISKYFSLSGKSIKFKATKEVKEILKKMPVVTTLKTDDIEKLNAENEKINRGHAVEMLLFNYSADEVLKSQEKIDGTYNGKKVQVKASLISFKDGKNNGTSNAEIVKHIA
ncbi:MAG: hypothetical protein ACI4PF_04750 [Christensenellales bacterium]